MLELVKFDGSQKVVWNSFVEKSKNGHFMFHRDYMEYHNDRFNDHSLMIYDKQSLIAILPATINGDTLSSHGGLTFGGFLTLSSMTAKTMLEVFGLFINYCQSNNVKKIIYKAVPYIYHSIPSQEDLYALFRNNAVLFRRDSSVAINYKSERLKYRTTKSQNIKKGVKENLKVEESQDLGMFWNLLEEVLQSNHQQKPVHTLDEISFLKSKFPSNIVLHVTKDQSNKVIAGAILYINKNCVHTQYLAVSDQGRDLGALDFLLNELILKYQDLDFFDFGTSNLENGRFLNEGLIFQKEGFGARVVVHDFYEINL